MNATHHYTQALDYLTNGRIQVTPARGIHCPLKLDATIGCTTVTFGYSAVDHTWRMTYVKVYGNLTHVHGDGCDATGFVIRDTDMMMILDELSAGV